MILGIVSTLKEYFSSISETSWLDIIPFILGLVFGFLICVSIYLLIVIGSLRKTKKKADVEVIHVDDEIIKTKINNIRNQYVEEASTKKSSEKIEVLKECCTNLVNDIAKVYYPESSHPIFELSISELILLDYYIMKRIEKLFSGKVLSKLVKVKVSTVLNIIDMKKKYDENKLVKAANKAQVPKIIKGVLAVLNFANPIYWVRKLMMEVPLQVVINKIAITIINVVGEETSRIYSKAAFVEDDEKIKIDAEEIEKMLGDGVNE